MASRPEPAEDLLPAIPWRGEEEGPRCASCGGPLAGRTDGRLCESCVYARDVLGVVDPECGLDQPGLGEEVSARAAASEPEPEPEPAEPHLWDEPRLSPEPAEAPDADAAEPEEEGEEEGPAQAGLDFDLPPEAQSVTGDEELDRAAEEGVRILDRERGGGGEPEPREDPGQLSLGGAGFGEVEKPPYRIPTVEEIKEDLEGAAGRTVLSTFSGCGGSCLGFRMAGYRVLWASEFVESARETYLANFPSTTVDPRDIREVDFAEVLSELGMERGEVDVVEGSPPCASFSTAGVRDKGWGEVRKYSEVEQRVDDLFWEFARVLREVQPKVFIAENVPGLLIGKAEAVFWRIFNELRDCGYRVDARVLDAAEQGVPQRRKRLIFQGVRKDLDASPAYPRPLPYRYTMRDAMPWLEDYVFDTKGQFGRDERGVDDQAHAITISGGAAHYHHEVSGHKLPPLPHEEEDIPGDMEQYAIGEEWHNLERGDQSEKYFSLIRPDPDEECPTITQTAGNLSAAGVTHPDEPRKFTIPELRRLCGFPDDFKLTGKYQQRWERLGRAVPPPLMRAVAASIRDDVLERVDD